MCNFFSAVVLKNGDVLSHPMIDSHSELVEYFTLPDANAHIQHFAKVELTPTTQESWLDPSLWAFRVDEPVVPVWWTDELAAQVESEMRRRVAAMIITDDSHPLLVDGCWIVGGEAKIREVRSGRIVRMWGGTLTEMWGGTLTEMWGGTLTKMWGGTLTEMRGGTLTKMLGGTLTKMWGGTLTKMWGGTLLGPLGPYAHVCKGIKSKVTMPKKAKPRKSKAAK